MSYLASSILVNRTTALAFGFFIKFVTTSINLASDASEGTFSEMAMQMFLLPASRWKTSIPCSPGRIAENRSEISKIPVLHLLLHRNKEKRFSKQLRSVLSFVIVCAQKKRQQSKVEQMRYPNKSYSALCLTAPDREKNRRGWMCNTWPMAKLAVLYRGQICFSIQIHYGLDCLCYIFQGSLLGS